MTFIAFNLFQNLRTAKAVKKAIKIETDVLEAELPLWCFSAWFL